MEVYSCIERAPVINEELNIVPLVDPQRGTRKLPVCQNHLPRHSCDSSVRPCQGNWKENCSRMCPLDEAQSPKGQAELHI